MIIRLQIYIYGLSHPACMSVHMNVLALQTLRDNGVTGDIHVVISALANTYINYVTTPEEYNVQRYEGASTIYGPHTLSAFIQEFNKLAVALTKVCLCISTHMCSVYFIYVCIMVFL